MNVFVATADQDRLWSMRDAVPGARPIRVIDDALNSPEPSVLIVDADCPDASARIASAPEDAALTVVVAAARDRLARATELLGEGADGILTLPADEQVATAAIEAARHARARRSRHRAELTQVRAQLLRFADDFRSSYQRETERASALADSLLRLQASYRDTVLSLAAAVEAKDSTTGRHIERVAATAAELTKMVDPGLAADPLLSFGFLLHDVGKIGVPDRVLAKPGPLDDEELEHMRAHAEIGARIVHGIEFLRSVRSIIRHHHERWDGNGYPDGLAGEQIPRAARIFAVADAADAMLHDRPYRKAMLLSEATEEIVEAAGTQFDPEVVEAFVVLVDSDESPFRAHAPESESR